MTRTMGARGAVWGTAAAALLLAVLAVLLLRTTGATPKVMVAVWLWAWPVLGLGFALGWLVERAFMRDRQGVGGVER